MSLKTHLVEEVRALESLGLEALRQEWRRRYGDAPKARSPELVRLSLAWRIQAEVLGGLDATTKRRLRRSPGAPARSDRFTTGTRIIKDWRGERYEIDRVADGFVWNDRPYRSLSAVAEAITGVKRNGPKFFGLREEG